MRIALVAYGCQPHWGSEVGIGWSWAIGLVDRGHEVVVYTHGSQKEAIERNSMSRMQGLQFRFHQPGGWPLEHSNRAVHQVQYTIWQWLVMDRIKLDATYQPFDLVHFLTWGGVRMPVFGWRMEVPYVIGPVGGGEEAPLSYCRSLGTRVFLKECLRKLSNRLCIIDPLLRKGYRHAKCVYAYTFESRKLVVASGAQNCEVKLPIGVKQELLNKPLRDRADATNKPLRLIFVGRLLYWKCPLTVIAVYREVLQRGLDVELTIVGLGPEHSRLQMAMRTLPSCARVKYEPMLPHNELLALLAEQDLAIFPSLHDSGGYFVLESMACGVPVLALALGGPKELLKNGGGILVQVERMKHKQAIIEFADHIQRLAHEESTLRNLREVARASAFLFTWPLPISRIYEQLEVLFGG